MYSVAHRPNVTFDNPSGDYCAQLGGTTAGHMIDYGGADWYEQKSDGQWSPATYDFCVFPDFSAIGDWTLAYHATSELGDDIKWGWNPPN